MVATSSKVKDPPHDMDVPGEIEIRTSHVDAERMGLWCKKTIKKGSRFGPFVGDKALQVDDRMDPSFIWEIVDVETKEFLFYINATDPRRGNWMRYINCARYFEEQNIVSEQDGIDIFFEAIKDIEPGRELLTWYEKSPIRRKKGKKRTINHVRRAKKTVSRIISEVSGSLSNTASSVSQRGRRRSAKKYWKIEENADPRDAAKAAGELTDLSAIVVGARDALSDESVDKEDVSCGKLGLNGFFEFELLPVHTSKNRLGRKMFQCDVCSGVYRHGFSLKRHYLRNHINKRYISRVDALNCNIALEEDDEKKDLIVDGGSSDAIKSEKQGDESIVANKSIHSIKVATGQNGRDQSISEEVVTTLQLDVDEIGVDSDESSKTVRDRTLFVQTTLLGLYRCYVCDKLFDKVGSLKAHFSESHATGADKRFACRHCQMQFKHRQNLVRHEVVHTGAKPYVCDHCNKRFPTLTNRRRHERIHRGTRLACPLCSSSFTQTNDLKKHVRRQHPESYRACAYCSRYFTADSQLSVHLRRVHPGVDLDANRRQANIQRDARSAALEADRAESRRLADIAAGGTTDAASASTVVQFACTVCNKSFADYANMCRHRRLAHGCGVLGVDPDESGSDEEEANVLVKAARAADHTTVVTAMDLQQSYFAGVSKNITTNLNCHVEGKSEHLARASSHIRWKHGSNTVTSASANVAAAAAAAASVENGSSSVRLEDFNFPHGFKIRPLSELYDMVVEPGSSSVLPRDTQLIQVPDVRMCTTCKSVFHSTAELEDHVLQNHDACAMVTPDVDPGPPVLVPEQPLDLRSPVTPTQSPVDKIAKLSVKSEHCDSFNRDSPVSFNNSSSTDIGKKILCLVCFSEFQDVENLYLHQSERHANIDCRHIEVDVNYFPSSSTAQPSVVGMLNVKSSQLPATLDYRQSDVTSADDVTCTKCHRGFPSRSALHAHIVECGDYWRNLSDRLTWVFVLRGSQIPAPPPASVSSTTSSARNKQQQKRRGKYRWGTISTSGDAIGRRLQNMLIRQHVGIPVTGEETGSVAMSKIATGGGGGSRRASARISSRRSSDSPPPVSSETAPSISRNTVDTRKRPAPAAVQSQNIRRHGHRRVALQAEDATKMTATETIKCDRCSMTFQTAEEHTAHAAAACCGDSVLDDSTGAGQGHDAENEVDEEDVFDPTKHLCIYCNRQFTFIRALRRHVTESCTVRRDLVEKNEYIDEEWETQLTALAGVGQSGGKSTPGAAEGVNDESNSTIVDGGRGGKRRRKCMNWTSSKSRSRRSARSSDDAEDSLFGWEDAFLSTWGKDEREDITKRDSALTLPTGSALTSSSSAMFAEVKASNEKALSDHSAVPVPTTDVKLEIAENNNDDDDDVEHRTVKTQVKSAESKPTEEADRSLPLVSSTPDRAATARIDFNSLSSDVTSTPLPDQPPAVTEHSLSVSTDPDVSTDVASIANSSATSVEGQANPDQNPNDGDEAEEPGQKKSRKRRGHRLTMVKRKKN